ncbi:MAG: hypothetical protein Unbinned6437contig1000_2 [Prokaryotic dsDNA virus sp.]|nr:MAG: hypothetical protein Unbinned6437contig1000_2 [Prokaryotic dsDNA virus sp.]
MESIGMNLILSSVFCFMLMPFASALLLDESVKVNNFGDASLMILTFLVITLFVVGLMLIAIGY